MGKNTFNPSADYGLSKEQVARQMERSLYNRQPESRTKSCGQIIRENTLTLFNLVNVVLAVFVIGVGSYKNALFINIVVLNTIIGIVQEIRAKRVIDKLSLISQPRTKAVRSGEIVELGLEEIVLSDVLILSTGKQIPADATVLEGEIEVNESLLTGESDPIFKHSGDTLLSGSYVVSGEARVRVDRVGEENYSGKLLSHAKTVRRPDSEIMRALNSIIKVVSIVIIPIGLLLFTEQLLVQHLNLSDAVTGTAAALIGMIPEGLVLLTSIALAVGVVRLARYKTLVQELYCIETLARVDVLCLDKTGTMTEGTMEVRSMDLLDKSCDPAKALRALCAVLKDNNATFNAIRASFNGKAPKWQVKKTVPFSSARRYSGASFEEVGTYVIGAPESLLSIPQLQQYQEKINTYASKGSRVLLMAHSEMPFQGDTGLPLQLKPVAFLLLGDKIRSDARKTLEYFAGQGVEIKVISGDNPLTVAEVAGRAGLSHSDRYIDASTLMTDEAVKQAAERYSVFGRVTPQQKYQLIKALKQSGHTVAMTGDGVNDVLALHEADCSIAMASGSDATRQISQLVLLDSNFANLTRVLMEGRRVINNISRAASLFLVKTLFSFVLAIVVILANEAYPFVPIQLTLISALMIGAPSFFLALESNRSRVSDQFITRVMRRALPGGMTIAFNIVAIISIADKLELSQLEISSMACLVTGLTAMIVLFGVCQPFNRMRSLLFTVMAGAFALAVLLLPNFFHLVPILPLDMNLWIVLLPMLLLVYPEIWLLRRLIQRIENSKFVDRYLHENVN